jgi:hypothetical protein
MPISPEALTELFPLHTLTVISKSKSSSILRHLRALMSWNEAMEREPTSQFSHMSQLEMKYSWGMGTNGTHYINIIIVAVDSADK